MKTIKATPLLNWLINDSKRVNFVYGSAGSGKSYQIAIYLLKKFFEEDNISILITRKTTPALRMTTYKLVLELLDKYFTSYDYNHNRTDMIIRFRNNDMIFKALDEASKIRSSEFNYIWLEEASEFSALDYSELSLRLRKPNSNGINQAICSTNPISVFSWIYTDLYTNPDPDIAKIKTTWRDNPFLDSTYIAELGKLTGNYRKIFYEGEFGMQEGLVFVNWEIYDTVFDTIKDHCYGLDFGYVHKSSLVKIMFREDGKFIADELIAESGLTNTALIERCKEVIPEYDRRIIPIWADSAEPDRITEFFNAGFNIHMARKDTEAGLDYCIQNFLGCTSRSVNLIKELKMYSFQKNRMDELMPSPEKKFDDSICAMRYGAYSNLRQYGRLINRPDLAFR
jgi:phage terminase large subunit